MPLSKFMSTEVNRAFMQTQIATFNIALEDNELNESSSSIKSNP